MGLVVKRKETAEFADKKWGGKLVGNCHDNGIPDCQGKR